MVVSERIGVIYIEEFLYSIICVGVGFGFFLVLIFYDDFEFEVRECVAIFRLERNFSGRVGVLRKKRR